MTSLWQVVGWALGDVKCLSALPSRGFYILPDWAEWILLGFISTTLLSDPFGLEGKLVLTSASIFISEVMLASALAFQNTPRNLSILTRTAAAIVAAHLPMAQDAVRLASKIINFNLLHICLRFDWMDGQNGHIFATRLVSFFKNLVYFAVVSISCFQPMDICQWVVPCVIAVSVFIWFILNALVKNTDNKSAIKAIVTCMDPLPIDLLPQAPVPFVILSFQRTGSNLLCGILHNHPEIVMHNEIFNDSKIFSYLEAELCAKSFWKWDIHKRDSDPTGFLADIYTKTPVLRPRAKAVGFKLFPEHWTGSNEQTLKQLLVDRRVKKIILSRKNYLDVYVSKLRSDKTGNYITRSLDGVRVHIDPTAFDEFIDYYDSCYAYMDSLLQGQTCHRVTYEDLTSHSAESVVKGIFMFLNVEIKGDITPLDVTVKQSTTPIRNDIVNYEEIVSAFRMHPKMSEFLLSEINSSQ